jgi:hypothetical protein
MDQLEELIGPINEEHTLIEGNTASKCTAPEDETDSKCTAPESDLDKKCPASDSDDADCYMIHLPTALETHIQATVVTRRHMSNRFRIEDNHHIKLDGGSDISVFKHIFLMIDLGEAHSKKVISLCNKYEIVKQATAGYTPPNSAIVERWFQTSGEMSRCQLSQFNMKEEFWKDARVLPGLTT